MRRCTICNKNMEGQQVTLDKNNKVYCAQDYDKLEFSLDYWHMNCHKPSIPFQDVLFKMCSVQQGHCSKERRNKSSEVKGIG